MVLLQHVEGEFDLIRRREIKLRPDGEVRITQDWG